MADNKIIFHNGADSTAVYEYDADTSTWSTKTATRPGGSSLDAGSSGGSASDGENLYLMLADGYLWKYAWATDAWTQLAQIFTDSGPTGAADCAVTCDGSRVYVACASKNLLAIYDILDDSLVMKVLPTHSGDMVGASWDGNPTHIFILLKLTGNLFTLYEYVIATETFTLLLSEAFGSLTAFVNYTWMDRDHYFIAPGGELVKSDLDVTHWQAAESFGLAADTFLLFPIGNDEMIGIACGVDPGAVKLYDGSLDNWADLTNVYGPLGEWAGGGHTTVINRVVTVLDSAGNPLTSNPSFSSLSPGDQATITLKIKAEDVIDSLFIHTAPPTNGITAEVSDDNATFTTDLDMGAFSADEIKTFYFRETVAVDASAGTKRSGFWFARE